jgi:hypothetical protein
MAHLYAVVQVLPTRIDAAILRLRGLVQAAKDILAMTSRNAFASLLAISTILASSAVAEAGTQIGKVVAVIGTPSASGPGGNRTLKRGSDVFQDDKIVVRNGNAQILLNDNTRLVAGPGATIVLDQFLMKGGNSAQKVSIKALRGTFRFITGRSNKKAYSIQTANATIGIRGTGFDCHVGGSTLCAVLEGVVNLGSENKSVTLEDDCEVGRAGGGLANELARQNAAVNISNNLPYIISQASLQAQFRLPIVRCARTLATLRDDGGSGTPAPPSRPRQRPQSPD